ncbi:MAG: hypothetical protein WCB68_12880 [Pyrinomonadaceae bacterium]
MAMLKKSVCLFLVILTLQLTPLASTLQTGARAEQRVELQRGREHPLWPGSRFTEEQRRRAIRRGLQFIYRTSLGRENFEEYGSDYLWCFFTLGRAIQDRSLGEMATRMGRARARAWRRAHRALPRDADANTVADFVFGSDSADGLGVRDDALKAKLRVAAARFNARDYLSFDPKTEPPPVDVPEECEYDGAWNPRGAKVCRVCKRPLEMKSRYDVWYDALITTYSGDHYGVELGAHYPDVLKWLPTMRPYRGKENGENKDFYEAVYAVTHIVYTLNDYSLYRLSPRLLPEEFEFLKTNLQEAIKERDADMLGEFMDTLRSLGLTTNDPEIRAGMEYYLKHQNRDGSWGNLREKNIYDRYHPTWNAVAGLSEYQWRGEGLSFPELKPLLEQWSRKSESGIQKAGVRSQNEE